MTVPELEKTVKTKRLVPVGSTRLGDYVVSLEWSPDGTLLVAAAADGNVTCIPREVHGGEKRSFAAHPAGMGVLAWHPKETLLATGGQDGCVKAWNPAKNEPLWSYQSGRAWIERMAWAAGVENPLLAVAQGKEVHLLDAKGALVSKSTALGSTVADLCWSPDGTKILAAVYGGLVVLDGRSAEKLKTMAWKGALWTCRWSPDGRWVCGGSQENAVHVWDAASAEHLHMPGYQSKIRSLDWSSDSKWLATSNGIDVLLWDCSGAGPNGRQPLMFGVHSSAVTEIRFQHRGHLFAAGGKDGKLVLWSADGGEEPLAVYVGEDEVSVIRWAPDDKLVAIGTSTGEVLVF